jgi:hypothetical protein
VNSALIVISLGVVGTVVAACALWYRGTQAHEMGSVSHTWIAELRAGEPYDSSR